MQKSIYHNVFRNILKKQIIQKGDSVAKAIDKNGGNPY